MTSVTDRRKKTPTFPQRERQHQEKAEGGRGLMVRTTLPPSVTRKKSCLMCVCDRNNAFWICFQKIGNSKASGECIWYDATTSPFCDSLILVGQRSSFYHHLSVTSVHLMGPAILQILSHQTQKTGPARCQNQSVKSKKNDGIQPLSE